MSWWRRDLREAADMTLPYRPLFALDPAACPNCRKPCEWLPVYTFGKLEPIARISACCMATTLRSDTPYR